MQMYIFFIYLFFWEKLFGIADIKSENAKIDCIFSSDSLGLKEWHSQQGRFYCWT